MTDAPAAPARPVLVLYAPADEPFVRGFLVPALGPGPVDARAGTVAIDELERALRASRAALGVITPAFLSDPWARLSDLLATHASVKHELDFIPLVLEDCELPLYIDHQVKLDLRSRRDWDRNMQRLRDQLARPAPVEAPLPCPYPGMRPFEAADAKYFHGREREIEAVLAQVKAGEREITLVGPSGSGKSSLIAAGVLPQLAAQPGGELVVRTVRPGNAPLSRLADCLEAPGATPDAAAVAEWAARHPGARLVVFIDQLEELFTLAPRSEQDRFAVAVRALRGEPRCTVLLALRADFYGELLASQLWLDGPRRHVDLSPLRGAALRQAIELPARALEVYLEQGLIERLLADAAGEPGVLPLLQETLVQLWSRRRERLLTLVSYEELGDGGRSGLAVAISSRADRCLHDLTPAQAVIARRLLLRLVSFGEGRPNTRRRQTRAALAAGEPPAELDAVLRQLVAARLVTMDGDDHTDVQVDLCHEVLITAWPPFTAWVEARRADEQRRRQIQASADEWIARGRGASGLLDDGELASAIAWRRTDAARELGETPEVTALVGASDHAIVRARSRWRRRVAAVFGALTALATVGAVLAVVAQRQAVRANVERANAERESANAIRLLGEQYREQGRQAVVDGHFQRAIPYLVAAREQGVDDDGLRMLFRIATTSSVAVTMRHDGPLTAVGFSDDATRIVTASNDRTARLWDASGAPLGPPLVHDAPVSDAAIRGDGARVVTITGDTAWLWDVTAQPPVKHALHHDGRIDAAVFSGDGTVVATASQDTTVRLWSAATGEPLGAPLGHDTEVFGVAIGRDGTRLVSLVTQGDSGGIWNTRRAKRIARTFINPLTSFDVSSTAAHIYLVFNATFSADGARIATTTQDSALIWDAATGKTALPPLEQHGWLRGAAFSPDGARLAIYGEGGRVQIWNLASHPPAAQPVEALTGALSLTYSRDGTRLLAPGFDKVIRILDVATGNLAGTLELEAGATGAAISPDGARVVTSSGDGLARIWTIQPSLPRVLDPGPDLFDAVYTPDGTRIVVGRSLGGVHIWSVSGTQLADLRPNVGATRVVIDREGRRVAAIGIDGSVEVGELTATRLRPFRRIAGRDPAGGNVPDGHAAHMPIRGGFSPDGRRFATITNDNAARVWDTESLDAVTPPLSHHGDVMTVQFSPDGLRVVTAAQDATARVWDATSGAPLGSPLVHAAGTWVITALFTPDGKRIVTANTDGNVRLWDATTHQLAATLTGHAGWIASAAFSPDGTQLLTASNDHSARLWDLATGELAAPPLEHPDELNSAAFSPDGQRIVTVSGMRAQVWDVRTGRPLGPPFVHPDYVRSASFSPDGSTVVTASRDKVRIWSTALDTRSLATWRAIAERCPFPQLRDTLKRRAPASHAR